MQTYQAYGLKIQSEFTLPELITGVGEPEIFIRKGTVNPPELVETNIQRQGKTAYFGGNINSAYLQWQGVGNFLAQDGHTLIVDPEENQVDSQLLNLYILSEALGLILHQRGFFLLHASAVKVGEQAIIFAGAPGAGKSTTAAAFSQQGYPVLGDDMVAMKLEANGKVMVYPAFPQVKIWQQSVRGLNYDTSDLQPLFTGSQKQVVRNHENFPTQPLPLAHTFVLEKGRPLALKRLKGQRALMSLMRFFPCPGQLLTGEDLEKHLQSATQVVHQVPMWKIRRPNNFVVLQKLVKKLAKQLVSKSVA